MKSSLHSLISFLPLFSIPFDCRHSQFSAETANSGSRLNSNSSCMRSSLCSLGADPRKHCFLCYCVLIHCCRDMFTAQLHSKERRADPQRTSLATLLLLSHDVTAYVTRSSAARVRPTTLQLLFLCLYNSCFELIRHNTY
jgi:hypothetical protein